LREEQLDAELLAKKKKRGGWGEGKKTIKDGSVDQVRNIQQGRQPTWWEKIFSPF